MSYPLAIPLSQSSKFKVDIGLGWAGLGWAGLGWAGQVRIGLDWIGGDISLISVVGVLMYLLVNTAELEFHHSCSEHDTTDSQ